MKPLLYPISLTICVLALWSVSHEQASGQTYFYVDQVTVIPANPVAGDEICLNISGNKSNPCVFVQDFEIVPNPQLPGSGFVWDMCFGTGPGCLQVFVPWDTTICLGFLPDGAYSVEWDGCSHDYLGQVFNFTVAPCPLRGTDVVVTDESCDLANGEALLDPPPGATPTSIIWSTGATNVDNISGLDAGHHSVTVSDSQAGCGRVVDFSVSDIQVFNVWTESFGGSFQENVGQFQPTSDGGYVLIGTSNSDDGAVVISDPVKGGSDIWVVKVSDTGLIQWEKNLGGADEDYGYSIRQTTDGGYILAGSAESDDGDVLFTDGVKGSIDYWVVKLSSSGAIEWERNLGGNGEDFAHSVLQTADGGYVVAGYSNSTDGDLVISDGVKGDYDYWVVKLSPTGIIQWERNYGGVYTDEASDIILTTDGGYLVAGISNSLGQDLLFTDGVRGNDDIWLVKISSAGAIQWERNLGGMSDEAVGEIIQTQDGGYLLAGRSNSVNGDVLLSDGIKDYMDAWVVKLSPAGLIQWEKNLGRWNAYDEAHSCRQTADGGFIIGGSSTLVFVFDFYFGWAVKLDAGGDLIWKKDYLESFPGGILETAENEFVYSGLSNLFFGGDLSIAKFLVLPYEIPQVVIDPPSSEWCEQDTLFVTAQFSNCTNCSYAWTDGVTDTSRVVFGLPPFASYDYIFEATSGQSGCTTSEEVLYTIHPNPVPVISITESSGLSPNDGIVCSGAAVTLSVSGVYDAYQWSTGETGPSVVVHPDSTEVYTLIVTDSNGCTAGGVFPIVVESNPLPNIAVTETSGAIENDAVICQGDQVMLSSAGLDWTYLWSTGSTSANIFLNPLSTASYSVTVTHTGTGCMGTDSQTVTVDPQSVPVIVAMENSGTTPNDGSICAGAQVVLSTGSFSSYQWVTGDTTQSIVINPASTATYTVSVTNSFGCSGADTVAIIVNPNPSPIIAVSENSGALPNDGILCSGATVALSAGAFSSYAWSTGSGASSINPTPLSNTTYSVTVTSAAGCSGTDSQLITVNGNPVPDIAVTESSGTPNDGVLCSGAQATLSADGFSAYQWSTGATTNPLTLTPASTTTYTVTVTNVNGCQGTDSQLISVNANPTPDIAVSETSGIANNDGVICNGAALSLSVAPFASYLWSTGDTGQSINPAPSSNTTFSVTVTNAAGCTGTDSQTITVNPNPVPDIMVSENSGSTPNDGQICLGASAALSVGSFTTYLWSTGAVSQSINPAPSSNATFSVTVTNAVACQGTDSQLIAVNPNPTPMITLSETSGIAPNDGAICQGDEVMLNAGAFAGYSWSPGGATTPSITQTPGATTTYSVTVTNSFGCTGQDVQPIVVNPLAQSILSGVYCPDESFVVNGKTYDIGSPSGQEVFPGASQYGCDSTVTISLTFQNLPEAFAGEDTLSCVPEVELGGILPPGVTGVWTVNTSALVLDSGDPASQVSELEPDENLFIWTLSTPACPGYDADTVVVTWADIAPNPFTDEYELEYSDSPLQQQVTGNVLDNDQYYPGLDLSVTLQEPLPPGGGTLTLEPDGVFSFLAPLRFEEISVTYRLQYAQCPEQYGEDELIFYMNNLLPPISEGFSPDGDGLNDEFIIPELVGEGLDNYPGNKLVVFNRWGQLVYEAEPYRNDWNGTFLNSNEPLPAGTYYFVIWLNAGEGEIREGALVLLR